MVNKLLIQFVGMFGTMSLALVSGTVNAVNNLTSMIQAAEGLENWEIALIQTVGLFGLYFTFFSGLAMDRFGKIAVAIVGSISVVCGYLIMAATSLIDTQASSGHETMLVVGLIIGYLIVGIGSGTTFLCAMGAAFDIIPEKPGLAVSLPGICMSLSMAFTIFIENEYTGYKDCPQDCWGGAIICLSIVVALFSSMGITAMASKNLIKPHTRTTEIYDGGEDPTLASLPQIAKGDAYGSLDGLEEKEVKGPEKGVTEYNAPLTPRESLLIFCNPFYWVVFFGFFCGISYGLLVVTQTTGLWEAFADAGDDSVSTISILFSFANALANIVAGTLSDFLVTKNIISRQRFISVYFLGCTTVLLLLALLLGFDPDGEGWNILFGFLLVSVGFGWGFSFTLFPTITSEVFGGENFGICYSFVNLGSLVASVVVPNLDGYLSQFGSEGYIALFVLFAGLLILSAGLLWIVPARPVSRTPPQCLRHVSFCNPNNSNFNQETIIN